MQRYSPPYDSPPRREYGGRARSPPRRRGGGGGGGGYGRNKEHGSLLVRNIPLGIRGEELRVPFERFGVVRDVYIPRNYHTGEPRGFAFVEFKEPADAAEARYQMDRQVFAGRELTVVIASENRKRPEDMRRRTGTRYDRGSSGHGGRRSHYGRSRSPSVSRSPPPRYASGSRGRHHSRSYSPAPRRRVNPSISPDRRQSDERVRSPREAPKERSRRLYSPGSKDGPSDQTDNGRSRSPSVAHSPSHYPSGSRGRRRSRSYSPAPKHRADHSISPDRRHSDERLRSPREAPKKRVRRSYSPGFKDGADYLNGNGRSRSPFISPSPPPRYASGSRGRRHSRSYSPVPRHQADPSISPDKRHSDEHVRSPREAPKDCTRRSYSPGSKDGAADQNGNRYNKKTAYEYDKEQALRKSSPGPATRSPSGSRSRSMD